MSSHAQTSPQWCEDHRADATSNRGPLGVHWVREPGQEGNREGPRSTLLWRLLLGVSQMHRDFI